MNSLDLYEFSDPVVPDKPDSPSNAEGPSSSSTTVEDSQPSLNEEVTQVIGQLGKFWGGFRKQSQTAFELARKDLGQVVTQAQKGIEKLGQRPTTTTAEAEAEAGPSSASDERSVEPSPGPEPIAEGSTVAPPTESPTTSVPASSSFLSRLQSSLPPNLTPSALSSTLQSHLPENLQHGLNLENANADFTQLRATLVTNIQRVQQGTTVQQAEKLAEQYMHRGEALFKEAGEFLKDAVKVVPPEEAGETPGVIWDGTDVWPAQTSARHGGSRKGKGKESDILFSVPRAAAKRADVLLKKLRSDTEMIRKDPGVDEDVSVKELWLAFVEGDIQAHGGIGGEEWTKRIGTVLEGHEKDEDAKALIALRDQLVPGELTNDEFWTRYFFRVHQIEREEERRKALLEGANLDDEDFSWEDEDDGEANDNEAQLSRSPAEPSASTPANMSSSTLSTSPKPSMDSTITVTPSAPNAPGSASQTPSSMSPRESEDSYDVVSSGNVSSTGGKPDKKARRDTEGATEGDGNDSDWE